MSRNSMYKKNNNIVWRHAIILEIFLLVCAAFLVRSFGYGLYRVPTGSMETTMLVGELFFANKYAYVVGDPCLGEIVAFNDPLFSYSTNPFVRVWQQYVWGPSNWTKRIIGAPGDHVQGVIEDGKSILYVNGIRMNEKYCNTYPLIGVFKESTKNRLAQKGRMSDCKEDDWSFKTYDPEKSFEQQPWYAIDAGAVIYNYDGNPITRYPVAAAPSMQMHAGNSKNYWNGSDEFDVHLGAKQYWVMGDSRNNSHDSRSFGPIVRNNIHGKIVYRLFSVDCAASWILFDFLLHPITFYKSIRWGRCMQSVF